MVAPFLLFFLFWGLYRLSLVWCRPAQSNPPRRRFGGGFVRGPLAGCACCRSQQRLGGDSVYSTPFVLCSGIDIWHVRGTWCVQKPAGGSNRLRLRWGGSLLTAAGRPLHHPCALCACWCCWCCWCSWLLAFLLLHVVLLRGMLGAGLCDRCTPFLLDFFFAKYWYGSLVLSCLIHAASRANAPRWGEGRFPPHLPPGTAVHCAKHGLRQLRGSAVSASRRKPAPRQ
jgi:hypothetical protein